MASIQQIPFYLPLDINFDSTQIVTNSYMDSYYSEYPWTYNVGSTLSFYDPISKFVLTDIFGNVIKEHIFITINEGGYKSSILYPIAIKTYKMDDKYNKYYPKTILLKSGIANVLSQLGTILNTKYYFISKLFLNKALEIINPEQIDHLLTTIAYKSSLESAYNMLEYINNEGSPSIGFDFTKFIDELSYNQIRFYNPDLFKSNETIDMVIDTFSPKLDYPIQSDYISSLSMFSDRISPKELLGAISMTNAREDDLAMTNTFVDKVLNKSDNVIFALNSVNYNEMFSYSVYSLYELFQYGPFKEGYIKYILRSNGTIDVDTNTLLLVNWHYSLRYDGFLHIKRPIYWINDLAQEITCLIESLPRDKVRECTVEVMMQDYHVLITINDDNYKTTIVFDMIVLMLLSKTLFFTEDQYTNDQYCYTPNVNNLI